LHFGNLYCKKRLPKAKRVPTKKYMVLNIAGSEVEDEDVSINIQFLTTNHIGSC
jgi:hypothetical protein